MIRIFGISFPTGGLALLLCEAILIPLSFVAACFLVEVGPTMYILYELGLAHLFAITAGVLFVIYLLDMYSKLIVESALVLSQQFLLIYGMVFLAEGLIGYLDLGLRIAFRVLIAGAVINIVLMVTWRVIYSRHVLHWIAREKVLLVGTNPLVQAIVARVAAMPETGWVICGYVDDRPAEDRIPAVKHLGRLDQLKEVALAVAPSRIIVGMTERRGSMPVSALLDLRLSGHIVEEAATSYERICHRVSVFALRPSQLVFSGEMGPRRGRYVIHAIFDVGSALIATTVLLPVMAVISLGVKFTSQGPILYRQKRIGLNGRPFDVLKFRSMNDNPDDPENPRTTLFGDFLRRTRLNELPQLINVLRRDMSVVGPRPERPEFVRVFCEQIPYYPQRHCVRPGITGWAQINYLHGDTVEDTITKLEYDLYYIKYMSQSLDLLIMLHTIKTVLLGRGAG